VISIVAVTSFVLALEKTTSFAHVKVKKPELNPTITKDRFGSNLTLRFWGRFSDSAVE